MFFGFAKQIRKCLNCHGCKVSGNQQPEVFMMREVQPYKLGSCCFFASAKHPRSHLEGVVAWKCSEFVPNSEVLQANMALAFISR